MTNSEVITSRRIFDMAGYGVKLLIMDSLSLLYNYEYLDTWLVYSSTVLYISRFHYIIT